MLSAFYFFGELFISCPFRPEFISFKTATPALSKASITEKTLPARSIETSGRPAVPLSLTAKRPPERGFTASSISRVLSRKPIVPEMFTDAKADAITPFFIFAQRNKIRLHVGFGKFYSFARRIRRNILKYL